MTVHTNELIHETSQYLLQHAHNPVQWYPWGEAALSKAQQEDKPILVSIGYAACHWCHVMERESFEDEETAAMMNENFINIKIDREERPDLDHIYMNAVQTMTGSGGWPLNAFLTPGKKPFYGGTYFPPSPVSNRPSWKQVLQGVITAFREKRSEVDAQADNLTVQLLQSNTFGVTDKEEQKLAEEDQGKIFQQIMHAADRTHGGFGKTPKFPQTFTIQFLLRHAWYNKNETALEQAILSLDRMIYGGIYDQLGGGFSRYATDEEWLVPHFEKMLYDNALLVAVLSEAYQLTKKPLYKYIVEQTIQWLERDLMHADGGFFSALDADSEGVEGKYYVWEKKEVELLLGEQAALFCKYYDITSSGNWEGRNILRVLQPVDEFALQQGVDAGTVQALLKNGRTILLKERNKRVAPLLDDKLLLSWNALMNTAYSKAYMAFGEARYKEIAVKNMAFLLDKFTAPGSEEMLHTYKNGVAKYPAFIDDYAYLVQALIHLQEITGNQDYLTKAKLLTGLTIDNFSEAGTGFFFYTHSNQPDVIIRIKEIYDGATPSGNSIMAWNLLHLSLIFDNREWKTRALEIIGSLNRVIVNYPTSFGVWACITADLAHGFNEIAVVGTGYETKVQEILGKYLPNKVLQASVTGNIDFPMLAGKGEKGKTYIYFCRNYTCLKPVENVDELAQLIDQELKR